VTAPRAWAAHCASQRTRPPGGRRPATPIRHGASTGIFGAVWAQAETRKILRAIGARVLDIELPVPAANQQFHPDGRLTDTDIELQIIALLEALADAVATRTRVAA